MSLQNFETERLYLRPVQEEDATFIFQLVNSPDWLRFIGDRNIHSTEDAALYIREKMMPQYERLGFGNYVVFKKSDNMKIGTCGLYDRDGLEGVDLGFAFLPEFVSQGYGYESAMAIMSAAKSQFNLSGLVAITLSENIPSQKLLEKLGFKSQGLLNRDGFSKEMLLYTLHFKSGT